MLRDYQSTYQNQIGSAKINITQAVAGNKINCRLTYKAGSLGIDDSGSIKILFRIATDTANPQFSNPKSDHYVKLSSNKKSVNLNIGLKSGGLYGKIHQRPWSKGFSINLSGDYLNKNNEIYVDFKKWRIQTFCEKTFEFKILVDPFATARYIELPQSPLLKIVPDHPQKLVIVAPTKVKTNQSFHTLIKLEDKWGNPCTNINGIFTINQNNLLKPLPQKVAFKNGVVKITTQIHTETTTNINAKYKSLSGVSNPITAIKQIDHGQYWADLHGQSEETVGTNDIVDYFKFAKNYALLDVSSTQCNDFQITNQFWKKINQVTKKFNKNNEYITIPGYEWSGNTVSGGDRNVLYLDENMPIHRSSHALIENFQDLDTDAITIKELFKKLTNKQAITIAHVGGRFANLSIHDPQIERAIEIHSDWGTFEWFLFEALKKNYKVGIVANSDGHTGRPGASYPSYDHFNNYGGLTCILATQLNREKIFEALYNRHCYATTGARIYLEVKCSINNKQIAIMGDEVTISTSPQININYKGTAPLDRMEIYNKNQIIHTYYPKINLHTQKTIKIVWSGSKVKGRNRNMSWDGQLTFNNNLILNFKKINFFNQKNYVKHQTNSLLWHGNTTGGIQGLILTLETNLRKLNLQLNQQKLSLPIKEITQKPFIKKMKGLDALLQIYQTESTNNSTNTDYLYQLPDLSSDNNAIFIKIIQKDGHMAWSSPIYISKQTKSCHHTHRQQ